MNIVIVGGGTAGWIAAALLINKHPNHKVTILESSKFGIIGVGEATTGFFTNLFQHDLKDFGVDHDEFMLETGSTLKFGIKHKGWTSNSDESYIGPIDGSFTAQDTPDILFAYALTQLPKDKLTSITHTGSLIDNNKCNFVNGKFTKHTHAMQVDGQLVGKYFKKKCLVKPNAAHIDSEITNVNLTEQGSIKSLTLSNGTELAADFFIDCSGFSRVLMNKLGGKWTSYKQHLPVNTGMPFLENYQEGEKPVPYSLAWAQKNGWLWKTTLMDRTGNGYIFDDNFTTVDKAQEEIETLLGRPIEPIKILKFESGRQENAWVKNCVCVGLSYAFLEPLEATSIHTSILQIKAFVYDYLKSTIEDTLNQGSMNLYNKRMANSYDALKDFLVMHYMGGRTDSEFWQYISSGATKTEFVSDLLETAKVRLPNTNDFPKNWGGAGWPLWSYIMAGINVINKQAVLNEFEDIKHFKMVEHNYKQTQIHMQIALQGKSYDEYIEHLRMLRSK
jgi:tryptophan halogenase